MRTDFAVFILSHGRADRIITLDKYLFRTKYSGKWYILIDNMDSEAEEYKKRYGDHILIFNKEKYAETTDVMDNLHRLNCVVYARNAVFDIAKDMGLKYIHVLDDDYVALLLKNGYCGYEHNVTLVDHYDEICDMCIDLLEETKATSVALSQGGDWGMGTKVPILPLVKRKVMNSFFFDVDRPVKFLGTLNEDANMYAIYGNQGHLFLTVMPICLNQIQTQSNKGGLTDIYLDFGTYVKSFYTIMLCPSAVRLKMLNGSRIHHKMLKNFLYPKYISEKYKKR